MFLVKLAMSAVLMAGVVTVGAEAASAAPVSGGVGTLMPAAPIPAEDSAREATATVQAYYDAINDGDYAAAWDLGGRNLSPDYETFVVGYADTMYDDLTVLSADGDTVRVRLDAESTEGTFKQYTGWYTVENGVITEGHMTRS